MIAKFDLWIGKHIFIPLAIRLCQLLRMTQYGLHTYIWLAVFFYNLSRGPHAYGWFLYTLMALMTLFWVVIAGLAPESMKRSFAPIRYMFVWFLIADFPMLMLLAIYHEPLVSFSINIFKDWWIVLAEYALCITQIPPLEAREKKTARKLARQET